MSINVYPAGESFALISPNAAGGYLSKGGTLTPGLWQYTAQGVSINIAGEQYAVGTGLVYVTASTVPGLWNYDRLTWTTTVPNDSAAWSNDGTYTPMNGIYATVNHGSSPWRLMATTNGTTWVTRTSSSAGAIGGTTTFIGGANNIWVVQNNTNVIYQSTDLVTWTTAAVNPVGAVITSISYLVDGYYAGTTNGRLAYSTDLITWSTRSGYVVGSTITTVAYTNGIYISLGGTTVRTSTDGITWVSRPNLASAYNAYSLRIVDNKFNIATASSGLYQSTDGITWTQTSPVGSHIGYNEIFWANSGTLGRILVSEDGVSWTTKALVISTNMIETNSYVVDGLYNSIAFRGNGQNYIARPSTFITSVTGTVSGIFVKQGGANIITGS